MRVLVTGATSPLGGALVAALLEDPRVEAVLAVGREPATFDDARVRYRQLDLTHPRILHDLIWDDARVLAIEQVVHAMQHRASRTSRGQRRHVHTQNVETTRELLPGCAHHPTIRRLVIRSFAEVYALAHTTSELLDEDAPLDLDPMAPQWLRDRVEADLVACAHVGECTVLRCAEIMAPEMGSQLWDFLQSRVCLRPLGFDPMLNVLSLADAVVAFLAALRAPMTGVFNIPGRDTLPLSRAIALSGRVDISLPSLLLAPLYDLRRRIAGFDFRYDLNRRRFHFGGLLDGSRARDQLGYTPHTVVHWT